MGAGLGSSVAHSPSVVLARLLGYNPQKSCGLAMYAHLHVRDLCWGWYPWVSGDFGNERGGFEIWRGTFESGSKAAYSYNNYVLKPFFYSEVYHCRLADRISRCVLLSAIVI